MLSPQLGVCFSSIRLSQTKAYLSTSFSASRLIRRCWRSLTVSALPATAKMCGVTVLTLSEYKSTPGGARNSGSGHSDRHRCGRRRSCCRTVLSSETVMNKNGEFSVAIFFVISRWQSRTLTLAAISYFTSCHTFWVGELTLYHHEPIGLILVFLKD
jgi:hypothetical protein